MSRRVSASVLLAVLLPLGSPPAGAQEQIQDSDTTVSQELARINRSLEAIVKLLQQETRNQELELAMRRVDLAAQEVRRVENDIRSAVAERSSVEEERIRTEASLEQMGAELESGKAGGVSTHQLELAAAETDSLARRLRQRLRALDITILELENRLAARKRDLADWTDFVDRSLSGG